MIKIQRNSVSDFVLWISYFFRISYFGFRIFPRPYSHMITILVSNSATQDRPQLKIQNLSAAEHLGEMLAPLYEKKDWRFQHPRAETLWCAPRGRVAMPLRQSKEHATRFCCIAARSSIIPGLSQKIHGRVLITVPFLFCHSHPYYTRLNL